MEVLKTLLTRMLDRSKRVQEAACSAFANLCEASYEAFTQFMPDILQTLQKCFRTYQRKNRYVLYDCTCAFVRNVRYNLREKQYLEVLFPMVMQDFEEHTRMRDKLTIALFECLMACCDELGDCMLVLAPQLVAKARTIVGDTLKQEQMHLQNPQSVDKPDRDICCSGTKILDLSLSLKYIIVGLLSFPFPVLFEIRSLKPI